MRAALISSFSEPPKYTEVPDPVPSKEGEEVVRVLAAALHPLAILRASGKHYTRVNLPIVPGFDAVGKRSNGEMIYFVRNDEKLGTFAELSVADAAMSAPVPNGADPVIIAGSVNPAMASWIALRTRMSFTPGLNVMILGATGLAGMAAVQVSRLLGAGKVIGIGRNEEKLKQVKALGADAVMAIDDDGAISAAQDVDVVLDFLWGSAAERYIDIVAKRIKSGKRVTWIQLGASAGINATVLGDAFRSRDFVIIGSGLGTMDFQKLMPEFSLLINAISEGKIRVSCAQYPLSSVEEIWPKGHNINGSRVVFVP